MVICGGASIDGSTTASLSRGLDRSLRSKSSVVVSSSVAWSSETQFP